MKRSIFKSSLHFAAFMLAALALASCAEDKLEQEVSPTDIPEQTETSLTTVALASVAGDANRVTYAVTTRAEEGAEDNALKPGELRLIATIANPSKKQVFGFTPEATDDGRWLSATSVFYNPNDQTYYATYHIQGNNYNTELETDVAGAIQMFRVDDDGTVKLDDYFRAANPAKEDYDFNHIYFDRTDQRIIVVGHKQNPAATAKGGNTRAIIGSFDPKAKTLKYAHVNTAEKSYDAKGKSLGYKDAGDVNCVVRANDVPLFDGKTYGWNLYFVATRKGMALLSANEPTLFQPMLTADGTSYFVKTPGSAKYVAPTGSSSYYGLLYLDNDHKADTGEELASDTSSPAKLAFVSLCTSNGLAAGDLQDWGHLQSPDRGCSVTLDPQKLDEWQDQVTLPSAIMPVDGKNTLTILGGGYNERYVALGSNGMYYKSLDAKEGVKKFGTRPVNCIAIDNAVSQNAVRGFLYVANGSKLTILNNQTLAEVASWQMPSTDKDGNEIASSANFVSVTKADNGERTIAVAFGQEGVCIFKFLPPSNN